MAVPSRFPPHGRGSVDVGFVCVCVSVVACLLLSLLSYSLSGVCVCVLFCFFSGLFFFESVLGKKKEKL